VHAEGIDLMAKDAPDELALTDGTETLTWSELAAVVNRVAGRFAELPAGARVGVAGENSVFTLVCHAAGLASGTSTVAVHRQGTSGELEHELTSTACNLLVMGQQTVVAAAELLARDDKGLHAVVHTGAAPESCSTWETWLADPPAQVDLESRPAAPLMVFTSGTTGLPRATEVGWVTPSDHGSAMTYAATVAERSGFPPGAHLVVGPLQHNGPLTSIRHLFAGGPVVIMPRFDAQDCLRLIERHDVSSTVMVPTHFTRLLALDREVRASFDVSSLRMVAHTGSACPAHVKRAMIDWFGPVLVESYGGSEFGTVARITSEEWLTNPGSVGRAVPPLKIAAYDAAGAELPPGETGVLGVELADGREVRFLGDEVKSQAAYLQPGVATLGDVGHVDDDGFVYITDRVSDMVLSGGVNLYPAECEVVLVRHDSVLEVAVIGIPDADMGEALHALVVPTDDGVDVEELDRFCRRDLAGYKCPRSYELVSRLERNEMGKINKRLMRRPFWEKADGSAK